jgi:hypothetical protein
MQRQLIDLTGLPGKVSEGSQIVAESPQSSKYRLQALIAARFSSSYCLR